MSVTEIPVPLVSEGSGEDRAALVAGLLSVAAFYEVSEHAPLPGDDDGLVIMAIRIPSGEDWPRGRRLQALDAIAEEMGVPVVKRLGTLYAERPFGPVLLQAHVNDADYTAELLRAADERSAAVAARGAA